MAPKTNTKQKQPATFSPKGLDPFAANASDGWTLPQSFIPSEDSKYFSGTNGVNMTNASYYNDINSRGLGNYYQGKQDLMTSNPSNNVSNIVTKASTDSLNNNLNNTAMAPETTQSSGPMSYLGEAWDKISGGADSFGSWMKDTFGAKQANRDYNQYLTNNPKTDTFTPMTANEFAANANREQELNNQQWSYGAQAGLGLGQLGLGVMSYLDKSAYNDKAMDLMDQQIANNKDIMNTRKERAADIAKAFGSGSAKTI